MWKSIHVATTCKSEGLHNWDLCEEGCCPRTVVSLLAVVTKGEIVAWEEEDLISNLCSQRGRHGAECSCPGLSILGSIVVMIDIAVCGSLNEKSTLQIHSI